MDESVVKFLRDHGVWELFEALAPSHQREYLKWIDEAKKEETRQNRLLSMVEMLKEKAH